jgi:hypothetical protein
MDMQLIQGSLMMIHAAVMVGEFLETGHLEDKGYHCISL